MTNALIRLLLIAILSALPAIDTTSAGRRTNVIGRSADVVVTMPGTSTLSPANQRKDDSEFSERDEIRRTLHLMPGARVEVSSIRGSVSIETANVEVAEVHIVRSARSRADLEHHKIIIDDSPQSLTIRGEQHRSNTDSGPDVRHRVMLKLPRRVELSVRSISGDAGIGDLDGHLVVLSVSGSLNVGAVGGKVHVTSVSGNVDIGKVNQPVEIKSVSGSVKIGQAVNFLDVSSVSGALSAAISKLGERGVKINSVSGSVELRFTDELDAQFSSNSVSGGVSIELSNVSMQSEPGASAIRAVIGKGGSPISINSVSGGVRLTQGN